MSFKIIFDFLAFLISIYATIMLIYCLASWIIRDSSNRFMRVLSIVTEPPLKPIRRFLSRYSYFQQSPIDFSPLILFFILRILMNFLGRIGHWL